MNILGIDIAKATFEAYLIGGVKNTPALHQGFDNTPSGLKQLQSWLAQHQVTPLHVCMEATGVYYEAVAEFLHQQGYIVSVVNPARIKGFAQSQLRRHKNDRQDARTIAQFCQQQSPEPWQPLSPHHKQSQALSRHLETLQQSQQQQKNRLESCREPLVAASLQRIIDQFDLEITQVKQQLADLIDQDPDLKQTQELLVTIPGIGNTTATTLLAELPPLDLFSSAKQLAAFVGLTPSDWTSGTSVRGRPHLSKIGNARIRKTLFFPALVAGRFNPLIQPLRQRLLAQGKAKMVVVGATMRKLIHIIFGVLKHRRPFDPTLANSTS